MHVDTTRFGSIEASQDDLVVFPDGIPGFAGRREMIVIAGGDLLGLDAHSEHPSLYWLQDVHDPDLAFLTTVPWSAYPDYDIEIDAFADADVEDLCILAIVTVRRDGERAVLTANLLAPIVIDQARRIGKQVILADGEWPVRAPLAESRTMGAS